MKTTKFRVYIKKIKTLIYVGSDNNTGNKSNDTYIVFTENGVWFVYDTFFGKHDLIALSEHDDILMQFTGLYDKNKNEDWVGDIVLIIFNGTVYYREIFQDVSGAFWVNVPSANSTEDASILLYSIEHENVGNIHENSGLLNQGK